MNGFYCILQFCLKNILSFWKKKQLWRNWTILNWSVQNGIHSRKVKLTFSTRFSVDPSHHYGDMTSHYAAACGVFFRGLQSGIVVMCSFLAWTKKEVSGRVVMGLNWILLATERSSWEMKKIWWCECQHLMELCSSSSACVCARACEHGCAQHMDTRLFFYYFLLLDIFIHPPFQLCLLVKQILCLSLEKITLQTNTLKCCSCRKLKFSSQHPWPLAHKCI